MIAVFIIFIIAGVAIVALLAHKVYEIKKGTTLISVDVREKADAVVGIAFKERKDIFIKRTREATRIFFISFKRRSRDLSLNILREIRTGIDHLIEKMKGRTGVYGRYYSGNQKKEGSNMSLDKRYSSSVDDAGRPDNGEAVSRRSDPDVNSIGNGAVSFFLKDVADHKESLRKKMKDDMIDNH